MTLFPKLKVEEHVEDDEIIHRSSRMSKHKTQKKITEKQQLSREKIRRRIKMIERQITQLSTAIDEHKKRAAEYKEMMSEHTRLAIQNKGKRQRFLQLDTQMRKYQISPIDDYQKLKNDRQEIQSKVKEYENISKQINNNNKTIKHLMQEMKSLKKEITDSKLNEQQRKLEIGSRFEEIQRVRSDLNDSTNPIDVLELLDNIEDLHEDIKSWAGRFESLNQAGCKWKEKNSCFENNMRELEDSMKLRDRKVSDINEHIAFLSLMLEIKRKMVDHKAKITESSLRKQQKEELSTRLRTHVQKMDDQQTRFMSAFKRTKEQLDKAKDGNINYENLNIKPCIEDIERKVNNIDEFGKRIEKDRNEISERKRRLEAWDSEIEQKCKETSCPEITNYKKEDMIELNDLCAKLDRWNREYELYEAEHDQWLRKKKQLEEKVKTVDRQAAELGEQATSINGSIACLNRMIDIGEKMVEFRKMIAKLIDIDKQKKDADSRWAEYQQKMGAAKTNADILDFIISKLREIKKPNDNPQNQQQRSTSRPQENASGRTEIIQGPALWSSFLEVINFNLSLIITNTCKRMEILAFKFELMGPSNLAFYQEKEEIEQWASQIEKKYEELKQKNEKLSGDNNSTHIKGYMDKIEHLIQEISSCGSDITKALAAWRKENDILENNTKILADKIKSQNEFIYFMLHPERSCKEIIMKFENQTKEANKRWNSYMNEYGQKIDRLRKNKDELVETLNTTTKYMYRREEVNQQCNFSEQENERNRDVEDVFRAIPQLTETAHRLMGRRIMLVEMFIYPLDGLVSIRYEQAIRHIKLTKEDIEMRLEEKEDTRQKALRCFWVMLGAEEILQNWEVTMNKLEGKTKALALNPFNIRIDGFQQLKGECLSMMNQHKAKTTEHEIKWSNYVRDNQEHIEKLDQINKWIQLMPHAAGKLSDINEKIDHCQKETNSIDGKIEDLRNEMAIIESMSENPRIFAIESMTPENITRVFLEMDKWNEMYESLKETVGHWEEKMMELEDNLRQWEIIAHEKCDDKLRDSSRHTGVSVL